jgi:hypothetical protein
VSKLLRAFLLVGAVQGYAIGLTGLIRPASIVGFPLETTPLNARFVASFYLAGAIGLTLTALAPRVDEMRVLTTAFALVTLLLLVVTVAYWSEYTVGGVPYPWLVSYIVDPIVGGALIVGLRLWSTEPFRRRGVGLVLLIEASAFCGLGIFLIVAPGSAIEAWPWHLTAVLARTYGTIFVALGVGALLAARERQAAALAPFLTLSFVFAVCGLVIYAMHHSRFDGSTATAVWLAANAVGAAVFAAALLAVVRRPVAGPSGVAAPAER